MSTTEQNHGFDAQDLSLMRMAKDATIPRGSKLEEIRLWARNAGIKKIGVAHCAAMTKEAQVVVEHLSDEFEMFSVGCKVGKIPLLELLDDPTAQGLACNPVGQVRELESWGCEFIIVVGLCLGHDMILARHCHVPMTILVVKDRAHHHNPMASLQKPPLAGGEA